MERWAGSFAEELAKVTEHRAGPVPRVQRRKRLEKQPERACKTDPAKTTNKGTNSIPLKKRKNVF
jgi:hypothetical protein